MTKIPPLKEDSLGKFRSNFERPYIIVKVLSEEALYLSGIDGDSHHELVNSDSVQKYFV